MCLNDSGANGHKIAWGINEYSTCCVLGNAGLDLGSLCVCMYITKNLYFIVTLIHATNRLFSQQLNYIFLSSIERKIPINHLRTPVSSCVIQKLLVFLCSHRHKENATLRDIRRVTTLSWRKHIHLPCSKDVKIHRVNQITYHWRAIYKC